MTSPDIACYLDYLSPALLERLDRESQPVDAVPGLRVAPGLREDFPHLETDAALDFVCALYRAVREPLRRVLDQRRVDRAFIDEATAACVARNTREGRSYLSPEYETVIGARDATGRVVVGPLADDRVPAPTSRVDVPDFLRGEQVTLFGPPDTARMSINAMNALHRRRPDEPPLVAELVEASGEVPRWGADNEDSKTPIMRNFLRACDNLMGCFDRSIRFEDTERGKHYALAEGGLAKPIKRIPGLALPDGNHLLDGNPLPLHLYDFAMHLFHNWDRPEALVFYVPKLENEEEAAYLHALIERAERAIAELHPAYVAGSVRLFIVFESPRSIFRIGEMAAALAPYFVGGSLGWHDFLGSTARLFRNDPNYRIPVKADPNIVIHHIRESHHILVRALEPLGGIAIGGMYGVLFEEGNPDSFDVSMVGYIKDVVTQLERGLDGFWVAHPDFVRIGLALVQAWRRDQASTGNASVVERLITELVASPSEREALLAFVRAEDIPGLPDSDPLYQRGVLAANIETSRVIANDDPEEVRYNVFQAVQYLAAWLSGEGCVALPSAMKNAQGDDVFVRVMDDLATTERSRWELWAEVHHGRVSIEAFEQILAEELDFIRGRRRSPTKRVQVPWEGEAARWYPSAARLLHQLVTAAEPVEFVTELLLPFTFDPIRDADDPWALVSELCPGRYRGQVANLVVGGRVLAVSDEAFAASENLLGEHPPQFHPYTFIEGKGQLFDSWETRRHNPEAPDWVIIALGTPGPIELIDVDTHWHDGNHAERASLRACVRPDGTEPTRDDADWVTLLALSPLEGHARNVFRVPTGAPRRRWTHVLLDNDPDGGIARLRLMSTVPADLLSLEPAMSLRHPQPIAHAPTRPFARPAPEAVAERWAAFESADSDINLAQLELGARVTETTNNRYGSSQSLLRAAPPESMGDGWETSRSRGPDSSESVTVELARPGVVSHVVVDFTYFVFNNPVDLRIEGRLADTARWVSLVERTRVKQHAGAEVRLDVSSRDRLTHVRLTTYPDGGANRFRVMGRAQP